MDNSCVMTLGHKVSPPLNPLSGSLTLALTCCRKPERRRSRATVLIVKGALYIFLGLHLLRLPGRPMLQHGVENCQELVHTRCQGDFFDFPRREEPLVKGFDPRVVARRHEGAHIQHGAHMGAASPNDASAAQGPTVTIEGRNA